MNTREDRCFFLSLKQPFPDKACAFSEQSLPMLFGCRGRCPPLRCVRMSGRSWITCYVLCPPRSRTGSGGSLHAASTTVVPASFKNTFCCKCTQSPVILPCQKQISSAVAKAGCGADGWQLQRQLTPSHAQPATHDGTRGCHLCTWFEMLKLPYCPLLLSLPLIPQFCIKASHF